jgi:hypothetical protein
MRHVKLTRYFNVPDQTPPIVVKMMQHNNIKHHQILQKNSDSLSQQQKRPKYATTKMAILKSFFK